MTDVRFLGEDDFLSVMESDNKKWRETIVKQGKVKSSDGISLNYYCAVPENPKAAVVVVHGMAEFYGKYWEYLWYLYQADYAVFFMEQRGFGYSEGKAPEHDLVYVDNYDTYVEDQRRFYDEIVKPTKGDLDAFLIAHSMGGCIGALFLEKYPDVFKGAILSSPMFKMKGANYSPILVELIGIYAAISGKSKKLAPGQKHFNPDAKLEVSSARSKARFEYQLAMRRADEHYQPTGATFGWAVASMKATRKVIKNAGKIKCPVNVMTAGDDHLIDSEGYELFKQKVPGAIFHHYEKSRHEIFNADEETRKQYFSDVLNILDTYHKG